VPDAPLIAIIPFEESPLGGVCREMGCHAVIPKAIKPAVLLQALQPYMV
jgi:hypothetical protein